MYLRNRQPPPWQGREEGHEVGTHTRGVGGACRQPHLIVNAWSGEGHVDGEGGRVVVRPQRVLSLRMVLDHKVHNSMTLQEGEGQASEGTELTAVHWKWWWQGLSESSLT